MSLEQPYSAGARVLGDTCWPPISELGSSLDRRNRDQEPCGLGAPRLDGSTSCPVSWVRYPKKCIIYRSQSFLGLTADDL